MSAPLFRPATAADKGAVAELFREHLAFLGYSPDPDLDADIADFPAAYAGPGDVFLLAHDRSGYPIAMGGVRDGEVVRIYVRREYRGAGLGQRVIAELIASARPTSDRFRAIVARSNTAALASFVRLGFVRTGQSPDHPKMGHCEILELFAEPR